MQVFDESTLLSAVRHFPSATELTIALRAASADVTTSLQELPAFRGLQLLWHGTPMISQDVFTSSNLRNLQTVTLMQAHAHSRLNNALDFSPLRAVTTLKLFLAFNSADHMRASFASIQKLSQLRQLWLSLSAVDARAVLLGCIEQIELKQLASLSAPLDNLSNVVQRNGSQFAFKATDA